MKKSGFTLIEILATIAIMTIIILLAVPGYGMIKGSIDKNMYENKLRLVEIAAENWASETGLGSVNIGHLIDEGKLEPDNEEGDYKNPLDDSSMRCKVIQI
ncbi:MAG: prepilin-type N-terminal cleavage/methylation domain-containing protein, partial [Bacilli bacterium]|nr:prepilin-type N-terminal cleavage/methylation domain-containing protein [Bacilli bacterium]